MDRAGLYKDIAQRTGGDIYLGVVGPVRTGKSTFIKRFSELLMLPNIPNEHIRTRVVDELPQSGSGRSVMTTQPKFVPADAVEVQLDEHTRARMRLVDCVGYMIPGALASAEEDAPRMVRTPWFENEIPFEQAAEIGTDKVIRDHSTIGIVMTTDGSITDLPRDRYPEAEEKAIAAAKAAGKPFIVVVNSRNPDGEIARELAEDLAERHRITAVPADVLRMGERDILHLLAEILYAFPLKLVELQLPPFMRALGVEHALMQRLLLPVLTTAQNLHSVKDYTSVLSELTNLEQFEKPTVEGISLGTGTVHIRIRPEDGLFYQVLSEACGADIGDEYQLMATVSEFVAAKKEYDQIAGALQQAKQTGYGIVPPILDEMELLDPEIIRQGSKFGVKLHAKASGLHLIRVDIDSEINPLVGSEQQSEALVKHLTDSFEEDPASIWQTDIFGKSLYDLVCDGMQGKVVGMNEQVQQRMQSTLQRIVNNGCNGLICIML